MLRATGLKVFSLWGVVTSLVVLPQAAWADAHLKNLACVRLHTAVLESGVPLGVTTALVHEALQAGLKAKVPQLRVDPSCPNRIYVKVFVQNLSAGMIDGFYGHVAFDVRRKAAFVDIPESIDARAWDLESYIHGTREKAKASVLDQINSYLTQFAADYQAANP